MQRVFGWARFMQRPGQPCQGCPNDPPPTTEANMLKDESTLTTNQKAGLKALRDAPGQEVRLSGVTGSKLAEYGFARRIAEPSIFTGRGNGAYMLDT